jgi:hypothetical protein
MILLSWLSNNRSSYSLQNWIFHLARLQDLLHCGCTGKNIPDVSVMIDVQLKYFEGWICTLGSWRHVTEFRDELQDVVKHINKELEAIANHTDKELLYMKSKYKLIKDQLLRAKTKLDVSAVSIKLLFDLNHNRM